MAATIDLLPRKEFIITLENGEKVTGKYGTWAMKRFCQKRNLTLQTVSDKLKEPDIDDAVEFVLSAVEQKFRESKSKEGFPFNDVDACMWIDELGGIAGTDFVRLFNHASDPTEEKKSGQETP